LHPTLISHYDHSTSHHILEVFAYYQKDSKEADTGTILRFVQRSENESSVLPLPGIVPVPAQFDTSSSSAAAYCDHWVSNVWSRTEFLDTLSDTLGFTPKVDFNAGVVAAGEAQIESTVTGNDSDIATDNPVVALKDQSQVYLPINNALSSVGHVHGFLQELGQGIQHLASRVENLVDFVQTANDRRQVFGEGFTFLRIPRSYYGILTPNHLTNLPEDGGGDSMTTSSSLVSSECADAIMSVLQARGIVLADGAVDLQASMEDVHAALEHHLESRFTEEYMEHKESVLSTVARSRYQNLFALLRDHLSEETYLGIVRNQILVDIQGEDLLFQIFTGNIMQRQPGHEAPFFEFIQRVCAECKDEAGCPRKIRPGCGGFGTCMIGVDPNDAVIVSGYGTASHAPFPPPLGIRNFLTLFLSIEVSKAIEEVSRARGAGDADGEKYAQAMVDYFTSQLNESNPILTEISDAMTLEGHCKEQLLLELAKQNDDRDPSQVQHWKSKMDEAAARKQRGNEKLMECSARYNALMKSLRERRNEALAAAAR
jgi:4-hydroxyphenylpyruvate dioxygenase-like putative hemolysin